MVNGHSYSLSGITDVRIWGRGGNDNIDLTGLTVGRRRELGRQWSVFVAAWTMDAEPETGAATPDGPPFAGQYWPRAQV